MPLKRTFDISIGKGVLGKDEQPFAPGIITYKDGKWLCPANYTVESLLDLLLSKEEVTIVDRNNREVTFTSRP